MRLLLGGSDSLKICVRIGEPGRTALAKAIVATKAGPNGDPLRPDPACQAAAALMFWLRLKKLVGSYFRFILASRS
jgi:hypothetical protein